LTGKEKKKKKRKPNKKPQDTDDTDDEEEKKFVRPNEKKDHNYSEVDEFDDTW
jgi:hypothetical protein